MEPSLIQEQSSVSVPTVQHRWEHQLEQPRGHRLAAAGSWLVNVGARPPVRLCWCAEGRAELVAHDAGVAAVGTEDVGGTDGRHLRPLEEHAPSRL